MKRGTLVIEADQYRRKGLGVVNRLKMSGGSRLAEVMPPHLAKHGIEFIHLGRDSVPASSVMDGYVLFCLLFAMQHYDDVYVKGSLTRELLQNQRMIQEVWRSWRPDRYRVIPVTCGNIDSAGSLGGSEKRGKSAMSFSGGLDSIFTLLRHTKKTPESFDLGTAVTALGFDMHLYKRDEFSRLVKRFEPALSEIGVDHYLISINAREFGDFMDWEDSHGLQIASVLHQMDYCVSTAVIASTWLANRILVPWGSTPILDHLMSGGKLRILSDGDGFSRPEKILEVAQSKTMTSLVKVCWQGSDLSKNCGVCGKCCRTRIQFAAAGINDPSCFDQPFYPDLIDKVFLGASAQSVMALMGDTLAFMERQKEKPEWFERLKKKLQPT
jgi:7-cyano-7-deazaguanine synthase in queuosine biosynthesis